MGLPMNNLHAPTVVSGSTSSHQNGDRKQLSAKELVAEKDRVWSELSALGSVLDSHGVNMTTSLLTFDGYPRPDLDVAQIRTTRARIIRLKNDYKDLMARIEIALQEHWANQAVSEPSTSGPTPTSLTGSSTSESTTRNPQPATLSSAAAAPSVRVEVPFAKVNSVVPSSPAATAGLRPGDRIVGFADVDWMNHDNLARVAQTVQRNEGRAFTVKVFRPAITGGGEERIEMGLTPRANWGGRGMLGCHLLPL